MTAQVLQVLPIPDRKYSDTELDEVQRLLEKFDETEQPNIQIDQMFEKCRTGERELWVVFWQNELVGVVVTDSYFRRGKAILEIEWLVGWQKGTEWCSEGIKFYEKLAKERNVSIVKICGRFGWQKVLDGYETKRRLVVLEKEIV